MSSPPITISLDFFNTEIQLPETYLQALLPFLASPPEAPYFKIDSEKHLKSFAYIPDNLSKRMSFFFFFGRTNSNLDSVTCLHLILKFQKFTLDHLYYVFYPVYQQFFETQNPARTDRPSSISRENNCVKIFLRVTASHLGKVYLSKYLPRQFYDRKDLLPWCV